MDSPDLRSIEDLPLYVNDAQPEVVIPFLGRSIVSNAATLVSGVTGGLAYGNALVEFSHGDTKRAAVFLALGIGEQAAGILGIVSCNQIRKAAFAAQDSE